MPSLHANERQGEMASLQIVPFEPALREPFCRLNAQWLEPHFHIEDIDRFVLGEPETQVLQTGGAIFFARLGEHIIGT